MGDDEKECKIKLAICPDLAKLALLKVKPITERNNMTLEQAANLKRGTVVILNIPSARPIKLLNGVLHEGGQRYKVLGIHASLIRLSRVSDCAKLMVLPSDVVVEHQPKFGCKCEIEVKDSPILASRISSFANIDLPLAVTREDVKFYAQKHNLRVHVGGRHVAILCDNGERAAIITGTGKDWN